MTPSRSLLVGSLQNQEGVSYVKLRSTAPLNIIRINIPLSRFQLSGAQKPMLTTIPGPSLVDCGVPIPRFERSTVNQIGLSVAYAKSRASVIGGFVID